MHHSRIASLAACLIATFVMPAVAQERAQEPVRRALLVGINRYPDRPLRGAVADAEAMAALLRDGYGFADVTLLRDDAATRAAITTGLRELVARCGSDDTVVFFFAGHGAQVEDLDGDEIDDQLDETLVPFDSRGGTGIDITDDELARLLAPLPTDRGVVILDCCHSGTGLRGSDVQVRGLPRDERVERYRQEEEARSAARSTAERRVVPVLGQRLVLLTGAAANQQAKDLQVPGGGYHGAFTWALLQALRQAPAATPRRLFTEGVEQRLRTLAAIEGLDLAEPQCEAPHPRLDEPLLEPTAAGAVVVPTAPPLPAGPQPVAVHGLSAAEAAALLAALQRHAAVVAADAARPARWHLEVTADRCAVLGRDRGQVLAEFRAVDPDARSIGFAAALQHALRVQALLWLDRPDSPLRLRLRTAPPGEPEARDDGGAVLTAASGTPELRIRRRGEPRGADNSLQLWLRCEQAVFVTLLHVDSRGSLVQIFPNPAIWPERAADWLPDDRLPAGEWCALPDRRELPNRSGGVLDATAPAGIDTIRAFVTERQADTIALRRMIAQLAARAGPGTRSAGQHEDDLALVAALAGELWGADPAGTEAGPGAWAAATLRILVRE